MKINWFTTGIWPSIQRIVFETGCEDYPYSSVGTAFLFVYQGRMFAITAHHVIFPLEHPVCFFASDSSQKIFPIIDVFYIARDETADDFSDFAIFEFDMRKMNDVELGLAEILNLENVIGDWLSSCKDTDFFILGYPDIYSEIDYASGTLITGRSVLEAKYKKISNHNPYIHSVEVNPSKELPEFSGFSGSPVFTCIPKKYNEVTIILCGMVIRGTKSSRIMHFIDLNVLVTAINKKKAPYNVVKLQQ